TSQTTFEGKRAAALLLVLGDGTDADGVSINGVTYTDRLDFLNSTGTWANNSAVHTAKDFDGVTTTGLGSIDFWIGGLAESITPSPTARDVGHGRAGVQPLLPPGSTPRTAMTCRAPSTLYTPALTAPPPTPHPPILVLQAARSAPRSRPHKRS